MPSTFFGLEIGRRALNTSQLALTVIGQNTANVGTAGYSRQVAEVEDTDPYGGPGVDTGGAGQLGTGVTVASVNRVRDDFVDRQIYAASGDQGALNTLRDTLGRVESTYGEPSATGVGSQITAFFNSFSDLAATPESGAVRATVLSKGQQLVSAFHTVADGLDQISKQLQSSIKSDVRTVNDLAGQIASLNKQIAQSIQGGDQPNDLLDKRTALATQLSGLVDVQVIDSTNPDTHQPDGQVQINVGGFNLVRGDAASALPAKVTNANGQIGLQTDDGRTIPLHGGEIAGLIQASSLVGGYRSDLDTVASTVIASVNAVHAAGVGLDGATGRPFFTGTGAGDIGVATAVTKNTNAIAAAAVPTPPATVAPGNGDNARALAALSTQPLVGANTLNQFYNARVAAIGADSQRFKSQSDTQAKVITQLQNQQASVSGVNLDEELTKLLQFQRSYQAAARIINVQDDVINTVINGLGVGAA